MRWLWLVLSIGCEVLGTSSLKLASSDSPHAWKWGVAVVLLYSLCFAFLGLCMKHFSLGALYATWSGLGVAMIAIIGVVVFGDEMNTTKAISFLLLIAGVVGLHLGGMTH